MADDQDRWTPLRIATVAVAALALFIAVVAVWIVVQRLPGTTAAEAMDRLKIVVGYEILILVFFFGLMILLYMGFGAIDLSKLLCEPKGPHDCAASMSRFQLLIFTFVISLSLFLVIVANGAKSFPTIPSEVLLLLGISASTYAVGKGIQASGPPSGGDGAPADAATAAAHHATEAAQNATAAAQGATAAAHGAAAAAHGAAAAAHNTAAAQGAPPAPGTAPVPPPPPPDNV
ncbi:MAG TPA: hypothetical protein VE075_09895 [Thermoanaerobaculia bacterium]|nr:hypothetical protein [Thermoanaerobaculia bacterium]